MDDLVRTAPVWAGCWRARHAFKCAAVAVRLTGCSEDESALRDTVLLIAPGGDSGSAGKVFFAEKRIFVRKPAFSSKAVAELADLLGLAWAFADMLIAALLKWDRSVPLPMVERHGSVFQALGGKDRVRPGEAVFTPVLCLALVDGAGAALRTAGEIARRAETQRAVGPKVRTKGAGAVIQVLLGEDAVAASAPGSNLSRWAGKVAQKYATTLKATAVMVVQGRKAIASWCDVSARACRNFLRLTRC